MSNFMNICPVGAELLHADRRTDVTKLTVIFCTYVNMPNDVSQFLTVVVLKLSTCRNTCN